MTTGNLLERRIGGGGATVSETQGWWSLAAWILQTLQEMLTLVQLIQTVNLTWKDSILRILWDELSKVT